MDVQDVDEDLPNHQRGTQGGQGGKGGQGGPGRRP
jgi:hypothetical protein